MSNLIQTDEKQAFSGKLLMLLKLLINVKCKTGRAEDGWSSGSVEQGSSWRRLITTERDGYVKNGWSRSGEPKRLESSFEKVVSRRMLEPMRLECRDVKVEKMGVMAQMFIFLQMFMLNM